MCRDVWYSMCTFRHGTERHAAMLGSMQSFLATPPASGSGAEPASFGSAAWPETSVAAHAPTPDPTAVCRKWRRFVWRGIGYTPTGQAVNLRLERLSIPGPDRRGSG